MELVRDEELVPHSNHASVSRSLGFTVPFSVAVLSPMEDESSVVTVGGSRTISLSVRFAPW